VESEYAETRSVMVPPIGGGGGRDWVLAEEIARERRRGGKHTKRKPMEKEHIVSFGSRYSIHNLGTYLTVE
jgi:hypothetical protein